MERGSKGVPPFTVSLCTATLPKVQINPACRLAPTPFGGVQRGATPLERGCKGVPPFESSSPDSYQNNALPEVRMDPADKLAPHRFGVSRGVQPLLERGSKGVSPFTVSLCPAALPKVQINPACRLAPTPFWGVQKGVTPCLLFPLSLIKGKEQRPI